MALFGPPVFADAGRFFAPPVQMPWDHMPAPCAGDSSKLQGLSSPMWPSFPRLRIPLLSKEESFDGTRLLSTAFTELPPKFGKAICQAFLALCTQILPMPYHDSRNAERCSPTVSFDPEINSPAGLLGKCPSTQRSLLPQCACCSPRLRRPPPGFELPQNGSTHCFCDSLSLLIADVTSMSFSPKNCAHSRSLWLTVPRP